MKPVFQTIPGSPLGNCQNACIASILEVPIEAIPPRWVGDGTGWAEASGWEVFNRLDAALAPFGVRWIQFPADTMAWSAAGVWCILMGPSPRSTEGNPISHAVVGRSVNGGDWEIVHDPHPDGGGLAEIRYVGLLVKG